MGLAGRAMGTLGILRGALLPCLWMIALLFLAIWELDAQTAVETKSIYIWQTGTVHPLYSFITSPMGVGGGRGFLEMPSGCMDVPSTATLAVLMKYWYVNVCVHNRVQESWWTCSKCSSLLFLIDLFKFIVLFTFHDFIKSSYKLGEASFKAKVSSLNLFSYRHACGRGWCIGAILLLYSVVTFIAVPEVNVSLPPDWGLEDRAMLAVFWLLFPCCGLRQLGLLGCPVLLLDSFITVWHVCNW